MSLQDLEGGEIREEHSDTHPSDFNSIAKTFHEFGNFPQEIQSMIFEKNLPPSQILDFYISIIKSYMQVPGGHIRTIYFFTAGSKFPGPLPLLPLLKACKSSNQTVHRAGFKKIELFLPENGKSDIYDTQIEGPEEAYKFQLKNSGPHSHHYTYIRPSVDTFMIHAKALLELYELGGSLSVLESLENIALDDLDNFLSQRNALRAKCFGELFDTIGENCQALGKLNLLFEGPRYYEGNINPEPEKRILAIDDYFRFLDPRYDPSGRYFFQDPRNAHRLIDTCISKAHRSMDELRQYVERKQELGERSIVEFWSKVEVVPAILGWVDRCEGGPKLRFPAIGAVLPCHDDGTLLDMYKGLAQIFDGAEW